MHSFIEAEKGIDLCIDKVGASGIVPPGEVITIAIWPYVCHGIELMETWPDSIPSNARWIEQY